MAVGNTGNVKAPSRYISWSVPSATVAVGETTNVSYTSAYSADPVKENLESLLNGLATVEIDATNDVVTFTGVSAGTVNLANDSPVGPAIYSDPFSLTVTAPVEDESYLNKRGLTHFWENIDDIKQNKLTAGAGILITNDVISATGGGTADAVDWGHITGSMSNQTDLTAALAAKANSADLATVATSGDYDDLTDKPTIGNATLTIQRNGTSAGTFTANATSNKTINITVPTTAADVSALPASTKYGASITVTIDPSDYKVTTTLKDQDGNRLGAAQTIDLPLESVVVNGSYDSTNKKIVLTLQSGSTIDIPVGDLVAGLQSEITSTNKLASDLVDDTNQTHKFVTAAQITKLNGIAAGAEVNVQSDWDQTTTTADDYIKNKPTLATVATSGSYNDLSNKPTIPAAQVNSDWDATSGKAQILNKPTLATVATSGSYNDLSNKPTIPAAQVQSNWTQTTTTAVDYIKNKPTLAAVATSGSYNDLSNKPTIPTVNNATLTIQKNGTNVQTFTANQSTNATANITVPTKTSDLTNDSGFLDSVAWGDVTGKPTFATVATSGSYNDLSNKPTIPTVNNGTLTIQKNGTNVQTFTANQSGNATANIVIDELQTKKDTRNSMLPSDVALGNKSTVAFTSMNALDSQTSGGGYADALTLSSWNDASGGRINTIVATKQNDQKLYHYTGTYNGSSWSGKKEIAYADDLSTVATSGSYNDLSNKPTIPAAQVQSNWTQTTTTAVDYIKNKPTLAAVATSGSYNDLSNKPTIPTVNNATLTIQKNGTTVKTFTANASSNVTANITVPTATSDLTNDSGFVNATAIAGKQDLLTAGAHINITGTTIKATDYVHSEQPVATSSVTPVVTGSMISNGTITADKLASGATVKLTLSTSDIGEGAALAANTLYGVYI